METMKLLKQDYEVEEGHGADRHPYLKENNINTYFIVQDDNRDSKVRGKPEIYEKLFLLSLGIRLSNENLPFSLLLRNGSNV